MTTDMMTLRDLAHKAADADLPCRTTDLPATG